MSAFGWKGGMMNGVATPKKLRCRRCRKRYPLYYFGTTGFCYECAMPAGSAGGSISICREDAYWRGRRDGSRKTGEIAADDGR